MAQQIINVGTVPNDGLGDPLRTAFTKTNDNFSQLFATAGITGIANGTSNVSIPVASGNVTISAANVSNVLTVSGAGVYSSGILNVTGLTTLSNLSVTGTISSTGTIQSFADVTAVNLDASANIVAAGYFFGDGGYLSNITAVSNLTVTSISNGSTSVATTGSGANVAISVGGASNVAVFATTGEYITGLLSASGNVTGANLRTGGLVSATGNVTGGNVLTGGLISATGNVTGNYILGNGALLTGVITSVTNISNGTSNVSVVSSGGNITVGVGGTGNVAVFDTTGEYVTGVVSASGNIISAGNVTGGNVLTGGLVSATANITGGNILTAGQIISTQTGNATTGAGQIYLNGTGNNRIDFNTAGLGAPTVTTRSAGTKVVLYPLVDASGVDYAIGVDTGVVWFSVHDSARQFSWYANTTAVATLTGTGNFSASGNITGGNVLTSGLISATGNIQVGNVRTAGSISATGNVLGNVFTVNTGNTGTAIINGGGNAVGNIGSSSKYFNQVFAQATTALYADLAEIYSADAEYAPGTVVSFGGDREVTKSVVEGDNRVAGVISENPSYLMNSGLQAEHRAAVALTGRVPTLVIGPVAKGDMMVSAGNGWARASATPAMGTVIGKALVNFDGDSGIIEIVVGRL